MSDQNSPVVLTREELEHVVDGAVRRTLTSLGIDHQNPLEMQQDFQALREWREAVGSIKRKSLLAIAGMAAAGAVAALWIGIKVTLAASSGQSGQ